MKEDSGGSSSGNGINFELSGVVMQEASNYRAGPRYTEPIGIVSNHFGLGVENKGNDAESWACSHDINRCDVATHARQNR